MILLASGRNRALLAIASCTVIGASLRIAGLGHLGLTHFDEGIYAMAGLWALSPGGTLDPSIIPYAPPGFPILIGLVYTVLGVSDVSAILPSVLCGIATIPVVGWIGWRTFGPAAGAASAAFAATSGAHVAFSRMALTDVSFLLWWLVAIGLGQRFLERPRLSRAVAMGLAVGLAQNFKYNGALAGVATALGACLGIACSPDERGGARIGKVLALGIAAGMVAALVYAPWFGFVEAHGGYAGLLAHQRGYMGGLSSWIPHWRTQVAQGTALSGGPAWGAGAMLLAFAGARHSTSKPLGGRGLARDAALATLGAVLLGSWPMLPWWLSLGWMVGPWAIRSTSSRVVGGWWLLLAAMTPFYHPYARLWLPLHAAGWIIMAGAIGAMMGEAPMSSAGSRAWFRTRVGRLRMLIAAVAIGQLLLDVPRPRPLSGLIGPSDSLREACHELSAALPEDAHRVRVLARPPIRFYLALSGKGEFRAEPDLGSLLGGGDTTSWVVVDEALIRQEIDPSSARARLFSRFERVGEWPSTLNPPTLLDLDPGASRDASVARSLPILLLRAKPPRGVP